MYNIELSKPRIDKYFFFINQGYFELIGIGLLN